MKDEDGNRDRFACPSVHSVDRQPGLALLRRRALDLGPRVIEVARASQSSSSSSRIRARSSHSRLAAFLRAVEGGERLVLHRAAGALPARAEVHPGEEERAKAAGLVERSGVLICAGLPRSEMDRLADVARFTDRERAELVGWSAPPTWASVKGSRPPGQGRFMVKVGGRPGIPFELVLTPAERELNDTNQRWAVQ